MNDFAYALGHTVCGVAEIAARLCHNQGDYLFAGYVTVVSLAVLVLAWLLLR